VCALAKVVEGIIQELNTMFLSHAIMDALGIMYPYYWLRLDYDVSLAINCRLSQLLLIMVKHKP
jgi:hypothetical protein